MNPLIGVIASAVAQLTARIRPRTERGASAVEYGLIVMLITAVIVSAVFLLGSETTGSFECTVDSLETKTEAC